MGEKHQPLLKTQKKKQKNKKTKTKTKEVRKNEEVF
jgi:hypothetical protein